MSETGIGREEYGRMAMRDAFALVEYWSRYPTPSMMMRAYFKVEPAAEEERDVERAFAAPEVAAGLGAPRPLPQQLRDAIAWAESVNAKMVN